jgi:RNA polymerase sigma factor (TIGR02999 family)
MRAKGEVRAPGEPNAEEVTALLAAWRSGEREALDRLMGIVYGELRRLAAWHLAGRPGSVTLQPTALVHEAYLRLFGARPVELVSRAHLLGAAAQAMRHVLVDHARSRLAGKRGGGLTRVTLADGDGASAAPVAEILDVDRALERLNAHDANKARVVELRYFGGLTLEEIAAALELSLATVKRHWSFARAWLAVELRDDVPRG